MKIVIYLLGFLNGSYMLLDGVYVMYNGKYIGPPKPGPWAQLFYKLNIDVFKLGPLFMAFGCAWLLFIVSVYLQLSCTFWLGILISVATLWYLPFGTLFALILLLLLVLKRQQLGF